MKKYSYRVICLIALTLTIASPAFAQADVSTATLKGTITDPTDAVVPGATVHAKSLERGIVRTARTDSEGGYQIQLLQPGLYEIRVEAAGFRAQVANNVELLIGQIVVYDLRLTVGEVTNEVSITADAPLIEVERTHQANTVDQRQVENFPNISRNINEYIYTLPGVTNSDAPRAQFPGFTFGTTGFSIGGSNGRTNLITIDGGENEYGSGQQRIRRLSVETVQEFQVNRNAFNAEFGFTAGSAVNVVTKSGTNRYHGSGFVYYRSQKTGARDFFDRGDRKAFDQRVYPGFTFGGPVIKNKMFFFTGYEHTKFDAARFRSYTGNPALLAPGAAQSAYLTTLETGPNANANTRRIAANLRNALTVTNNPNAVRLLTSNEGTFTAPTRFHTLTARLDYQVTQADSLSARFTFSDENLDNLGEGNGQAPSNSSTLSYRDYTTVVNYNHTFGANLVNQLRAQLAPNNAAQTISKDPTGTNIVISGLASFGRNSVAPFLFLQDRYQFEDILAWSRGKHNLKFGASYRPFFYTVRNEIGFSGIWTFAAGFPLTSAVPAADRAALTGPLAPPATTVLSALQAFSNGLPAQWQQGFNNPQASARAHYFGSFAQDSWKALPRLTLDYGVRVDYFGEPDPINQQTRVAPRVGFAWDPFGDQKTVIRGGGGLFYAPVNFQTFTSPSLQNEEGRNITISIRTATGAQSAPALWAYGVGLGRLPFTGLSQAEVNAFGIGTGPGQPGRRVLVVDPDYENAYSIQGSFGVTRQLMRNLSLDVAYQVYRGVHLPLAHETNYRESGVVNEFGPQFVRIDPNIAQRAFFSSIGNSIYHGMTASLSKRFSGAFQLQVNYTFSKTIDDTVDFNSTFNPFIPTRLFLERGLSVYDIRHNFVASGVFRSPFKRGAGHNFISRALADITLSPIVFLRSGIPFTLRIGRDVNGDTYVTYDRVLYAARNTGLGPSFYNTNLRLTKLFFLRKDRGLRVEFIAEATNLFNQTNFLSVNDVVGADPVLLARLLQGGPYNLKGDRTLPRTAPLGFTSAASARQFQFGLKLVF